MVNGGGGERLTSFFSTAETTNGLLRSAIMLADWCSSAMVVLVVVYFPSNNSKVKVSSYFLPSLETNCAVILSCSDALTFCKLNMASIVQYSSLVNCSISRSRSTTRRVATDCTRPAESQRRESFCHNNGDNLYPTKRSRTRRACWASTNFISMVRGVSNACAIADSVIS